MAARMEKTRHPGIYRRGGRYVVIWRHKGRQHKAAYRTLAEAREAKGHRDAGERRPSTRAGFDDYAREWLENYRGRTARGVGDRTLTTYRSALLGRAVPFFSGYRLAEVEPPDVRRYIAELEAEGLAPSTVRRELAPLRAMYATALEDGAVRTNPTTGVRVSGSRHDEEEEPRAKALTREQLAGFLAEVPDEWRLFFELLAHSGLRVSEAIGLTWADVEFGERPRLRVHRQLCRGQWRRLKSSYGRRDVPLSPAMARKLWGKRRGRRKTDPLFVTRSGSPLRDENVRSRILKPASERAGVPWVGFHTFRHTCASLLFEGGKNVKQVQEWLGHHDAGFTLKTYVHLIDDGLGGADFLDQAVKAGEGGNRVATEAPGRAAKAKPASSVKSAA